MNLESRGGKHFPGIPKGSACIECRKQKVRCVRQPSQPSCQRCRRGGISCRVKRVIESPSGHEAQWRTETNQKLLQVEAALSELLQRNALPPLSSYGNLNTSISTGTASSHHVGLPPNRTSSPEPLQGREIVSEPMGSILDVTGSGEILARPALRQDKTQCDLPTTNLVSLSMASELFDMFNQKMNQYLWGGIALVHSDFASVQRSSSLLSAAILTVACLHIPGREVLFDKCYDKFVSLVANAMVSPINSLDDIRALVIGAFWLSNLSWKLSGLAVRIATELNLHQSYQQVSRGDTGKLAHLRLWYLIYVCDHHFSIAYGRPPMIHESDAIRNHESCLRFGLHGAADLRILSQVALFTCLTDAYHAFGIETNSPLEESDLGKLREFNLRIENWRVQWQSQLAPNSLIHSYPAKGVVLHYHFAKLQLHSLAIRGLVPNSNISLDRSEAGNIAIFSAIAAISMVLHEPDVRQGIIGVPLFKHTMITFAAVFLLKVAWKWSGHLHIDPAQVLNLVQDVVNLMRSANVNRRHLVYHIANGLAENIEKFRKRIPFPVTSVLPPRENGSSHLAHSAGAEYAEVFDDFVVGDGLSFAMDDWLLPTSLDGFPGYQQEALSSGLWNEVQSEMSGNSTMGGNW